MLRFSERWRPRAGYPAAVTNGERGGAVVEFVLLGALLLVPVVYFVVTVGTLQGASYAAAGAADHAAKIFVRAADPASARANAEASVSLAMSDFAMDASAWIMNVACDRPACLEAGGVVTVTVGVDVPLPLAPDLGGGPLKAGRVGASASQVVGRFR